MAESLCADIAAAESGFRGSARRLPGGDFELEDARLFHRGAWIPFAGEVRLAPELGGAGPLFGRELEIWGGGRCRIERRNPGTEADGLGRWHLPRVFLPRGRAKLAPAESSWTSRGPSWVEAALDRAFPTSVGWRAVERAVWLGEVAELPPPLLAFYRDGGLLHVLSLGGQRVQSLLFVGLIALRCLLALLIPIGAWRFAGRVFPSLKRALPVAACALLAWASASPVAMRRVLAMVLAQWGLRARRLQAGTLQVACSSVACLIVWDPSLVGKPGFLLSAAATAAICWIAQSGSWKNALRAYFAIGIVMPIALVPLNAFCFARVSWLASLHGIALGWIWYWGIAPAAFLLPAILWAMPFAARVAIGACLDRAWKVFVAANVAWSDRVATGMQSVIRPTVIETLLVETALLLLIAMCHRACFPPPPEAALK